MSEQSSEWRPVVGYEGIYEISRQGQVRRVGKAARIGKGRGGGARIDHILKDHAIHGGYRVVQLWRDGHYENRLVHRLVVMAFVGQIPDEKEINHRDGNKANNSLENLECVTRSENNLHAYRTGLRGRIDMPKGENHPNAKLTAADVQAIRQKYRRGVYGAPRLAMEFGVNPSTIHSIVTRETWKAAEEING